MAPAPLKIAFASTHDPRDVRACSGIPHFAYRALQRHVGEVTLLQPPALHRNIVTRTARAAAYALRSWRELSPRNFDVALVHGAALIGSFAPRRIPLVYTSDVTWQVYEGYYPAVYRRPAELRLRRALERRCLRRADLLVFSSQWAADSAVRHYGVPAERVEVIPYGANLPVAPPHHGPEGRAHAPVLELLFLGVNWERKGGAYALEAVRALNRWGVPAHLTVCGCVPPADEEVPGCVTVIPFLDKGVPADAARFHDLLRRAHFLLLPTRADATPIAFCEANAHGLPVITTRTGGIPSVVEDGVNGRLLPLSASGEDFARVIADEWRDREAWVRASHRARQRFEERLNWDAWGRSLSAALARRFPARGSRAAAPGALLAH